MNRTSIIASIGLGLVAAMPAWSVPAQVPLFLAQTAEPMVMINMSVDHQLFYKAYDDWTDLDGDGAIDSTYNNAVEYFGYFDSGKCYNYDTTDERFEPAAIMNTLYYCDDVSGEWSGNFLNWASMARIDTVRKILYGGLRSTDSDTETVLERTYLPGDAHSFAKYYGDGGGGEIARLTPFNVNDITICNTTYAAEGRSETITAPPLLRVAQGNFALWAANERHQCHWDGRNPAERQNNIFNSPNSGTNNGNHPATTGLAASADNPHWATARLGEGDYAARVQVCVSGLLGGENCKVYPTSSHRKPIGLLQEYGDNEEIRFGLMTGSYQYNKSGGTLRKNVGLITDEINVTTDGTFKTPPAAGSIIGTLNRLRVRGYEHNPGYYNIADSCPWGINSFTDGSCTNWGNPQSELYLETLRYFAGATTPNFNANNDSSYLSGLSSASSWVDPLNNENYCSPVQILQFNASVTSYDTDDLGGVSDLYSFGTLSTWTDKVGTGEGIAGGTFFIGEGSAATTTDGLCTAKSLTNLSSAEGLCPEAPRLEGGYDIAGLAYYAWTETIRNDLTDDDGGTAEINVETFGVTLAPAVPSIEVPVPGSDAIVRILPSCRNDTVGGNCAIVDFKVVQDYTETPPGSGQYTGRYYVNWEDSEQGGDYDQDMAGLISFSIDSNEITVTTSVFADSTGNKMGFGYVISGTTQDGFHAHSGIYSYSFTDPTGVHSCGEDFTCTTGAAPTSWTYTLGSSTADLLQDPLYYAAKWGGFEEKDDPTARPDGTADPNGEPDQAYEWDSDGDGRPDNYFFAINPAQLGEQLERVFDTISKTTSASAVVANSVSFQSTTRIYQARFDSTDWSGQLLSFPLDSRTGAVLAPEWDTGEVIMTQDPDDRVILTWDPLSATGIPFRWAELNLAQQALLDISPISGLADTYGDERVDYLRGDQSNEQTQDGGFMRIRETVLGDNVNSSPAIVGEPSFSYVDTLESTTFDPPNNLYSDFRKAYDDVDCFESDGVTPNASQERLPVVYFGGNDGMLHGVSACDGSEVMAYVPNALFGQLPKLTDPGYDHRYFVDGAPTVVDGFFGSAWRTVLVGSTRAGGNVVFALDVTDPADFRENNAQNVVLWEIDSTMTGFEDLGYTFSQPAVVKAKNHGWVAIFGNGFHSATGKAVLYIVDLDDGDLQDAIVLNVGPDNGLATVAPVDSDRDGLVDIIYAGDLKGNVWRLEASGGSDFGHNNADSLLYSAKEDGGGSQPITTRLEVGRHPTQVAGRMVYFGTGKYYAVGDNDPATVVANTFYGLYDDDSGNTIASVTNHTSSATLQRQEVLTTSVETFGTNTETVRTVSDASIDWSTQKGWYLDLPTTGEGVASNPILRGGRLIFVTTIPSLSKCKAGGDSWLMEIAAENGGRIDEPVFDLDHDGNFDFDDMVASTDAEGNMSYTPVSGKKSKSGILQPPAIVSGVGGEGDGGYGKAEAKYASASDGGEIDVTIESAGLPSQGRKSWIQFR
jgi:type IV pilus assembly protein PilY1